MINGKNLGTIQTFKLSRFPKIGFQAASPVQITGTTAPPNGESAVCIRVADDAWGANGEPDHLEIFLCRSTGRIPIFQPLPVRLI